MTEQPYLLDPDWRPSWAHLLEMVEAFCQEEETVEELRWLRAHPVDWLIASKYMRKRVENYIAKSRAKLKLLEVTDPVTGRPHPDYLHEKRATDALNGRRMHWCQLLDEQTAEAKHILGWESVSQDTRGQLADRLVTLRMLITSELFETERAVAQVDALLRTYADEEFDGETYTREDPGTATS